MADLQSRVQGLCENEDLEESKRREVQQTLQGGREQWRALLESAKRAVEEEERHCALEGLLTEVHAQRKSTTAWLEDKRQALLSLDTQADPETSMYTAQVRGDMGQLGQNIPWVPRESAWCDLSFNIFQYSLSLV